MTPTSTTTGNRPGPSPTKRRRLSNSFNKASSSHPASSSSSKSTPASRSTSTARTPFDEEEYATARRESAVRVLGVWSALEKRYARTLDEDDIIDLRSGRIVQDRGVLKSRDRPWHYGRLLDDEDKDDDLEEDEGTTTDGRDASDGLTGVDDDEEEDEEEQDGGGDDEEGDDELQLLPEQDDDDAQSTSDDELGEWDTVPAPPSLDPSPSPPLVPLLKAPDVTQDAFSFLHKDVRPKLEKLAREREQSPLPAQDLEAFLAAESKLTSRPGYVEPEPEPAGSDDDVVFLGYGRFTATSEGEEGEDTATSGGELAEGEEEEEEESEDELNDWPTIPAPLELYETEDKEAVAQDLSAATSEVDHVSDSQDHASTPASDSEDEAFGAPASNSPSPIPTPLPTVRPKPKGLGGPSQQPFTPPHSNSSTTVIAPSVSPQQVRNARPYSRSNSPVKSTPQTPSKRVSSPKKSSNGAALASTPISRIPRKQPVQRTPSLALVPEVVVPSLQSLNISPSKAKPVSAVHSPTKGDSRSSRAEESDVRKRKRRVIESDEEDDDVQEILDERMNSLGLHEDEEHDEGEATVHVQDRPTTSRYGDREDAPSTSRHHTPWRDEVEDEAYESRYDPVPSSSRDTRGHERTEDYRAQPGPSAAHNGHHPGYAQGPQHYPPYAYPHVSHQPFAHTSHSMGPPQMPPPSMPYSNAPSPWSFQFGNVQAPPPQARPAPPAAPPHEALLAQVLYSLNYLAYQNTAATPPAPAQQPQYYPPQQFAAPLPPHPSHFNYGQGYEPVTSPQMSYRVASTPVESVPSRRQESFADGPMGRSILRVGGRRDQDEYVQHPRAHTTVPVGQYRSGLGVFHDPKGKGKEVEREEPDRSPVSPTMAAYDEARRAMSVTFSDPPSAGTPKGHYSPMLESPRRNKSFPSAMVAPVRPSPLRKVASSSDETSSQQRMASSSPTKNRSGTSSRSQKDPPRPLATSNSLPNLEPAQRSSGDSNSMAVLAKARAALSSSAATTASLGLARSSGESRKSKR